MANQVWRKGYVGGLTIAYNRRLRPFERAAVSWSCSGDFKLFPTDDINVRKAIELATNREAIVNNSYKGVGTAAYAPLTQGTLGPTDQRAVQETTPATPALPGGEDAPAGTGVVITPIQP